MKKIIATSVFIIASMITFSQNNKTSDDVKYVSQSPNNTVALTIVDYTKKNKIRVASKEAFYKYEILDKRTAEPVYASQNEGLRCVIDKTKMDNGTYDLKLYTSNFVITTDLEILKMAESLAILKNDIRLVEVDQDNDVVFVDNDLQQLQLSN